MVAACGVTKNDVQVSKWLDTEAERQRVLINLVTYTDKIAPGANFSNRDSIAFVDYYQERLMVHEFANYFIKDSVCYFQLYKIAPSLFKERIAIAGRFTTDGKGKINQIEEVYITPKLKPGELELTANELFINLVENDHVNQFMGNRKYVEFPDSLNTYNTEQKRWVFKYEKWFGN